MNDPNDEIERLKVELRRAYRALNGFYGAHVNGRLVGSAMVAYHAPTLGAARRYLTVGTLEGASYFENKPIDVLITVLGGYHDGRHT